MTKEELLQLVDATSSNKTISEFVRSRKKLSKALDAALKQARMDALEEAAVTAWSTGMGLHMKQHDVREVGSACADAIRALKEKA